MSPYQPPFTFTNAIVDSVARISERLGVWTARSATTLSPKLRRGNRIQTIQASLAIEHNTLSIEQVSAVIDDKPVFGPPREIQEVRNAFAAYEKLGQWSASNEHHLLEALEQALNIALQENDGEYETNDGVSDRVSGGVNDEITVKLDSLDQQLLGYMRENPYITQDNLVAQSGKSLRTIQRRMRKLRQHHIERIGSDKSGYWQVKQ